MSTARSVRRKSALFAAVSLVGFGAGTTQAADLTWNGGGADNNLSTPLNWSGGVAPVANDALIFDGAIRVTPSNDFPVGPPPQSFTGITFASGAGGFNLGGNAFILNGAISQNATANAQISAGVVLEGSTSSIGGAGAGTLSLGAITFGAAAKSANASTLNVNRNVSATSLLVQTSTATNNTLGIASGQ